MSAVLDVALRMISVPAHQLQNGDIVALSGTWSTVGRVTAEHEESHTSVHVVLRDHGRDRVRSWRILASEDVAILRADRATTPGDELRLAPAAAGGAR